MKKLYLILTLVFNFSFLSFASFPLANYQFARPSGMGNAFLAVADDANAIFYNPAALAKVKGLHFNLLDIHVSADSLSTFEKLKSAVFDSQPTNILNPNKQALGINLKPTFLMPYFGISFFNQALGYFDLDILQNERIIAQGYNDLGAAIAFGIPFSPYFSFGFGLRAIQRSSINLDRNTSELISELGIDSLTFISDPWNALNRYLGVGYAFPLFGSIMFSIPKISHSAPLIQLTAAMDHIGDTHFTQISGTNTPSNLKSTLHFGSLLQYQMSKKNYLNIAADFKDAFQNDLLTNKIHLGVELKTQYFGLRSGVSQGYPTFGASLEFPPQTRLHFSTFAMEMGNSLWEREERWYQVQLIIGFNPI